MDSHSATTVRFASPPHDELRRGDRPVSPDDDPFYRAPEGYEHAEPGAVLRSRDVEIGFLGLISQPVKATQLLYRTTNLHEEAEVAVTTVLVPAYREPDAADRILSYQCAIDAVASRCFPSFAMRRGAGPIGAFTQAEYLLVTAALAEGWTVCVPDHEGCHGMWGAPVEPGYRILDGLRAAMRCERLDLSPSAPVGLWGYSGGGLASAWAAELSEQYAPELNIVGAVLGSPVGDPGSVARRLNCSFFAGLAALMISALTEVFPGAQKVVDEHATDEGKALLDKLKTMTTAHAVWCFHNVDIGSYVDMTADELWDLPEVRHIFDETKLGKSRPKSPVLVIQAVHDGIISVDDVDALVAEYQRIGAAVTYHRDRFCGHLLLHPLSAPMTLRWLRDRFADRPVNEHKTRTVWPTLFNPSTYLGMAKLGVITAKVVLGRSVERHPLSTTDAQ
ncbi:lipase [Mycobacterium sp. ACS4054]|uniref:lipase family protein n=1 Tax=Mycobacterium sp. ACS4054 TaxID=1834119 RepID=UPI000801A5DB|nr:lipase family protein [Mycobacterium sp. ACS4054]OBF06219.1 lipase [Mycobacterium sp. ACS4054]